MDGVPHGTGDLRLPNRAFTQEDPIGIAGGLNLYGYANGDPINFSDPFGLDPCESSSAWTECLAQGLADFGARSGSGAVVLAGAALNAFLEASGINAAASAGNALGEGELGSGTLQAGAALFALGRAGGKGARLAIGKMDDFARAGIDPPNLPNLGSPRANWRQNAGALRAAMRSGQPIADIATDPSTGALLNNTGFLAAERNLLRNRG